MNAAIGSRPQQLASDTTRADNYPGVAGLAVFRRLVRLLLDSPDEGTEERRAMVVRIIGIAQDPDRYIDELLTICSAHRSVDRLNVAIDILSQTGELVRAYAWAYLRRDIEEWHRLSERAYEPNDDYWYILLRSVARATADDELKCLFIKTCSRAATRGMREAVVEALRDLGADPAKGLLRHLAQSDDDEFIRCAAQDALDDLEGR